MAKKRKTPRKPNSPWTGRSWHLMTVSGPASPLLVAGSDDGKKNRFRLVASSTSGKPKRISAYKVKFSKGAMTQHWNDCILVARGKEPLALKKKNGAPLGPLGTQPSAAAIQSISGQLVAAVDSKARIGTSRLECDVTLPAMKLTGSNKPVPTGKKQFGLLRLFQVPNAIGREALLVIDFAVDRGQPGGSGGGGSVHP